MPECVPEPVPDDELERILTAAIVDGKGGGMTREAEVYLAGVCAAFLVDRLALAGLVVMRAPPLNS